MSSIGLNTNTFRITGKYLQMLNDFVVKAKMNQDIDGAQKDHLIDFITKLRDENSTQPQFQLLSNIIERELRPTNNFQVYLGSVINEIKENMEVIGADGVHVGTVDKVEGSRIVIHAVLDTRQDPASIRRRLGI